MKKKIFVCMGIALASVILIGCGAASTPVPIASFSKYGNHAPADSLTGSGRKVATLITLEIETVDPEYAADQAEEYAREAGGYCLAREMDSVHAPPQIYLELFVPLRSKDFLWNRITNLGDLLYQDENATQHGGAYDPYAEFSVTFISRWLTYDCCAPFLTKSIWPFWQFVSCGVIILLFGIIVLLSCLLLRKRHLD